MSLRKFSRLRAMSTSSFSTKWWSSGFLVLMFFAFQLSSRSGNNTGLVTAIRSPLMIIILAAEEEKIVPFSAYSSQPSKEDFIVLVTSVIASKRYRS